MSPRFPASRPIIGIPADSEDRHGLRYFSAGEKYMHAVHSGANALPLIIPVMGDEVSADEILDAVDGLLLTGAVSNVDPHRYGASLRDPKSRLDRSRDANNLPLILRALERGVPFLAICRGHQELNVALGGTLIQSLPNATGQLNHRAPTGVPQAQQYGPAHPVSLTSGGVLAKLANAETIIVNSLHAQAIDRLAPRLVIEATAPDGVIEAVQVEGAASLALGLQWHPEWDFEHNAFSTRLFAMLGEAVRRHRLSKREARSAA